MEDKVYTPYHAIIAGIATSVQCHSRFARRALIAAITAATTASYRSIRFYVKLVLVK